MDEKFPDYVKSALKAEDYHFDYQEQVVRIVSLFTTSVLLLFCQLTEKSKYRNTSISRFSTDSTPPEPP
jgi:hypothetical protein